MMSNQGRLRAYQKPGRFVSRYEYRVETHPAQMYQPDVSPSGSWRRPFSATRPLRTFGSSTWAQFTLWAGEADVAKVELSFDSGTSWTDATLVGELAKGSWRLWEYPWQTPATPGRQTIIARATDSRGNTQSRERGGDRGTYMINHLLPTEVEVR